MTLVELTERDLPALLVGWTRSAGWERGGGRPSGRASGAELDRLFAMHSRVKNMLPSMESYKTRWSGF